MSLSNELEDLLSGYLDNQLNADELRKVQVALQNPAVQERYDELCQMRADLKALAAIPVRSLPGDFAQRVLAAVAAQSESQPQVQLQSQPQPQPQPQAQPQPAYARGQATKWLAGLAGLAATIALAIWIPRAYEPKTTPVEIAALNPTDDSTEKIESPVDLENSDLAEPAPPVQFVRRDDLKIQFIMTLDLELSENSTMANSLSPLLQQHGIQVIKGAKVEGEVKEALEKIRVTLPPEDAPLPSEVYLLRAAMQPLDTMLETMRMDLDTFPVFRFGLAFELPSDPLLDKLSLDSSNGESLNSLKTINGPVVLSQSMADAISGYVDADDSFAAPLVAADQNEFRASPFEAIPVQGKLVGSSKRLAKSPLALSNTDDGKSAFLLMFVRQR